MNIIIALIVEKEFVSTSIKKEQGIMFFHIVILEYIAPQKPVYIIINVQTTRGV
jgi:hypothetical protein